MIEQLGSVPVLAFEAARSSARGGTVTVVVDRVNLKLVVGIETPDFTYWLGEGAVDALAALIRVGAERLHREAMLAAASLAGQ
jgi:hypothetical protein